MDKISILNKANQITDTDKNKFSIEALVNLIKMIDISYSRLISLLDDYENNDHEEVSMQAWLVVGNFNRLRALLGNISGVKKNEAWFQLFIRKVDAVEVTRHIVEHYDSELQRLIAETRPLLGHISWVIYEGNKQILVKLGLPGTIRKFKGLRLINPAGKVMRAKIDHITYYLGDNELELSNLYYDLQGFTKGLEEYIRNKYPSIKI